MCPCQLVATAPRALKHFFTGPAVKMSASCTAHGSNSETGSVWPLPKLAASSRQCWSSPTRRLAQLPNMCEACSRGHCRATQRKCLLSLLSVQNTLDKHHAQLQPHHTGQTAGPREFQRRTEMCPRRGHGIHATRLPCNWRWFFCCDNPPVQNNTTLPVGSFHSGRDSADCHLVYEILSRRTMTGTRHWSNSEPSDAGHCASRSPINQEHTVLSRPTLRD